MLESAGAVACWNTNGDTDQGQADPPAAPTSVPSAPAETPIAGTIATVGKSRRRKAYSEGGKK